MRKSNRSRFLGLAAVAVTAIACVGDDGHGDDHGHEHETEIISTVELTFSPAAGGDPVVVAFRDPDGDGGMSGTADDLELVAGETYSLSIRLLNELDDPAEDITEEVREEAEEHMVFLSSPMVSITYADLESDYGENLVGDDLPVGLVHTVIASAPTSEPSELRVVLRHLPELNGEPQKTAELPMMAAAGEALPGDVDVDVTFALTVQVP